MAYSLNAPKKIFRCSVTKPLQTSENHEIGRTHILHTRHIHTRKYLNTNISDMIFIVRHPFNSPDK